MEAYYREQAGAYDRIYRIPAWQEDLAWLRHWVARLVSERTVLEIAAGTGYWTEVAAPAATSILACDLNAEPLDVAAKRGMGPNASFLLADAYALPDGLGRFDVMMAHFWWSHVLRQTREDFLVQVRTHLKPGGLLLMIDQSETEAFYHPASRWDAEGNRYEMRRVAGRGTFEIVKNYPDDRELHDSMACLGAEVRIMRLRHLWALSARVPH